LLGADDILARLETLADPARLPGMARYGIEVSNALGVSIPALRGIARTTGRDHTLALALWRTGVHEARILASMVDEPTRVTIRQMNGWASSFDSWDLCDQACTNLFDRTSHAVDRATAWSARPQEFVRRAAFATIAGLAVHRPDLTDDDMRELLVLVESATDDDRNYVRKAVSWALRQIGKRSAALNAEAIASAQRIRTRQSRAARWIAADALRELTAAPVRRKLDRERPQTPRRRRPRSDS
jgi:3-methyladenine DNA glycosylase AlkD